MNAATQEYISAHAGDGADAISAAIAADMRLNINIDTADFSGFIYGDPARTARLEAVAASSDPSLATLAFGVRTIIAFLQTRAKWVGTAVEGTADTLQEALAGLQQVYAGTGGQAGFSADECTALNALGGGFRYDRITSEQVQAELDRMTAATAASALRNFAATGYNLAVASIDAALAAHTDLPTRAELAALFAQGS